MPPFGPTTRDAYDRLLQSLVGRRVSRVVYFEVDMDQDTPLWACVSSTFDSLDFGLELHLDDGDVFSFTWDSAFAQYSVAIDRARMPGSGRVRQWDATDRWGTRVAGPIAAATTDWTVASPQSLTLRFGLHGAVVIASVEPGGSSPASSRYADQITVFFDEAEARLLTGLPWSEGKSPVQH